MPNDYKDYTSIYGAGRWGDFFGIMDPFYQWKNPQAADFYTWILMRLEGLDEMHRQYRSAGIQLQTGCSHSHMMSPLT